MQFAMRHELRDYQKVAADFTVDFLRAAGPGEKRLLASPTGSGKSLVIAAARKQLGPGTVVTTPRVEIILAFLDQMGHEIASLGVRRAAELAEGLGIVTPVRLRNLLAAGRIEPPRRLLVDEVHHGTAPVYRELELLLNHVPMVGFTATPFRGTPRGTAELLGFWGDVHWILTEQQAVRRGVVAAPRCRTIGLVDDDLIDTSSGDIEVTPAGDAIRGRLDDLIEACRPMVADGRWDRPTMLTFPTVDSAADAAGRFDAAGLPTALVTGDTPPERRQEAFRQVVDRRAALVHVGIVTEGIDLPELRRGIDCRPTLSPVLWMQTLGRIRRPVPPGESPPEYLCTNRNLARHAYLLEGILPIATVAQAQAAFPTPGRRAGIRVVGLEGLGRFRAAELPLAGGLTGVMYAFSALQDNRVIEYVVLLHPARMAPIVATRRNRKKPDGSRAYGRWAALPELPVVTEGFASLPATELTDKQRTWWRRCAARRGLDPAAPVNRRNFVALPVLTDLRASL
jgi:superfamily II DNA or RNA helicase